MSNQGDQNPPRLTEYILKNITGHDVSLSDLIYYIPAGQSRNLLGRTARLKYEDIMKSRESGCIAQKLGKSIIEVTKIVVPKPPLKKMAEPMFVKFPQRTKSSIVIDVNEVFDESKEEQVLNEEDALLKELEKSYEERVAPLVSKKEDEKVK